MGSPGNRFVVVDAPPCMRLSLLNYEVVWSAASSTNGEAVGAWAAGGTRQEL